MLHIYICLIILSRGDETIDEIFQGKFQSNDVSFRSQKVCYQNGLRCCGWLDVTEAISEDFCTNDLSTVTTCREKTQTIMSDVLQPIAVIFFIIGIVQLVGIFSVVIQLCQEKAEYDALKYSSSNKARHRRNSNAAINMDGQRIGY